MKTPKKGQPPKCIYTVKHTKLEIILIPKWQLVGGGGVLFCNTHNVSY